MEKSLDLSACADYHQRNPKESLLYNIFSKGLSEFLSTVDNDPNKKALPQYVTNELEAFLKCRIPEESGFSRWRCDGVCGHEIFVAHSCKKRGFCPSCGGRRMSQTAANLTDFVIPKVPIRQWVISLPMELRFWLAKDPNLLNAVNTIINREISRFYKERAISDGVLKPHTGAITFIQRAGGQINLISSP